MMMLINPETNICYWLTIYALHLTSSLTAATPSNYKSKTMSWASLLLIFIYCLGVWSSCGMLTSDISASICIFVCNPVCKQSPNGKKNFFLIQFMFGFSSLKMVWIIFTFIYKFYWYTLMLSLNYYDFSYFRYCRKEYSFSFAWLFWLF